MPRLAGFNPRLVLIVFSGTGASTLHYILSLYSFLIEVLHGHTLLIQRNPSLYATIGLLVIVIE